MEPSVTHYEHIGVPSSPWAQRLRVSRSCVISTVASFALTALVALFIASALLSANIGLVTTLKAAAVPHTGEWCSGSGAALFSKATLKRVVDQTVSGLLMYNAIGNEKKFEASDVIRLGEFFYVVCDSSWSILKASESLPLLSESNALIHPDVATDVESWVPPDEESGFEAIVHDMSSFSHGGGHEDFYLVRESIKHGENSGSDDGGSKGGIYFAAQILKAHVNGGSWALVEACSTEFTFEGDSKGFEGAISLRGKDGVLYMLALCEGNYCEETRGKQAGNGRVVVMAREPDTKAVGGCLWKTKRVINLPKTANFIDYSAFAVHHSTQAVAITSQENSQLWVGQLSGGSDESFDPDTAEFTDGKVFDFPRTSTTCELQYCNIEGIHWVSGSEKGTPQMLVAVSDKMKSRGRQSATCQDKDQSIHLFMLP